MVSKNALIVANAKYLCQGVNLCVRESVFNAPANTLALTFIWQ